MPTGHDFLSPRDFGRAIGVSESTVKRWVDSGELRVMRTPGRHRRIVLSDAVRFVRDHQCRIQDPGLLGMDQTPLPPRPGDDLATQIHDALVSGDEVRLRQRVLGAYLSGMSVHALGDGPVRIAFARIGELWKHDDDGIAIEHQAVQAMMRLMGMLRRLVPTAAGTALTAVGGAPSGDPYQLPSQFAELTLIEAGWRAISLGPDTPSGAFRAAMARYRPRVVWLSISTIREPERTRDEIQHIAQIAERTGARLLIGGRMSEQLVPESAPCDRAESLCELACLAQSVALHSPAPA